MTLDEMADDLALMLAKTRCGNSVYMDGSHNPLPSERTIAARWVRDNVAPLAASASPLPPPPPPTCAQHEWQTIRRRSTGVVVGRACMACGLYEAAEKGRIG